MSKRLLYPFLLVLLWCSSALAAADIPTPDANAAEWLKMLYAAATAGEWKLVGGLGLVGLTFALRTWGARLVPWFATRLGGAILSFAVSIAGTIGIAIASGAPIGLATFAAALGTAATAAGMWEWLKTVLPKAAASNEATKTAAAISKATTEVP
jgi:hypothetical protein